MENKKLVYKIAWSFHRTTGLPMDDLVSEAFLAYYEAQISYNPALGCSPTTWAWFRMRTTLINFTNREKRYFVPENFNFDSAFFPNHATWDEFLEDLPADCRELGRLTIEHADKFADMTGKAARGLLVEMLRQHGWSWSRIWGTIKNLKDALNETSSNCII